MKKFIVTLFLAFLVFSSPINLYSVQNLKVQAQEQTVLFNTKTNKYHKPTCIWAIRCTRNCISIPKSEAIKRGGIPCKVCGG